MAELIRCDRCKKTTAGRVVPDKYEEHESTWPRRAHKPGGPTAQGWKIVRLTGDFVEALLCAECVEQLKRWLTGSEKRESRAN